jgi:hypothetical protein
VFTGQNKGNLLYISSKHSFSNSLDKVRQFISKYFGDLYHVSAFQVYHTSTSCLPCDLQMNELGYSKHDVACNILYCIVTTVKLVFNCHLITINVVRSNPAYGEVYSIQHYVIKFVSVLRQVGGFLRVLRFPPSINLTATI